MTNSDLISLNQLGIFGVDPTIKIALIERIPSCMGFPMSHLELMWLPLAQRWNMIKCTHSVFMNSNLFMGLFTFHKFILANENARM